ncbi:MAG: rhodanese-like domain-containing protein [Nitrospirota bacterium]
MLRIRMQATHINPIREDAVRSVLSYIAILLGSLIMLSLIGGAIDARNSALLEDRPLPAPHEERYHHAHEAMDLIRSGGQDFLIIDMRHKSDYERSHLPGAVNILFKDMLRPENLARLPMSKDIIICCAAEHEQERVVAALRMLGYKAYGINQERTAGEADRQAEASLAL